MQNYEVISKLSAAALLTLCLTGTALAQVYKTTDADGNVVYTDEPPEPDAKPMVLPEVGTVKVDRPQDSGINNQSTSPQTPEPAQVEPLDVPEYNLTITNPRNEQNITGSGTTLQMSLSMNGAIPRGHSIRIYIDGEMRKRATGLEVSIEEVWRGKHTVQAELVDGAGTVLSKSDPVVFYMQPPTVRRNR